MSLKPKEGRMGPRGISAVNLRSLDVLRGLLALYVVITHARWLLWQGHPAFISQPHARWETLLAYASGVFKYGHLAVMVFFALSGFFIHLRMAQKFAQGEQSPRLNTAEYLRRRAWRVLPVYYFALALTVVIDLAGRAIYPTLYRAATPDAFLNGIFVMKGYGLEAVVPALLLVPRSLGFYFGSNGPLWSLGFEMLYYLAYPAWFALRRRYGTKAYLIGFGVALVAGTLRGYASIPLFDWLAEVVSLWSVWLAGAWVAELTLAGSFSRRAVPVAGVVACGAWVASHIDFPWPARLPLLVVLGCGVTLAFALLPARLMMLRVARWCETLGKESYTLYVCHFPVIAFISARCFELTKERPSHAWFALYGVAVALLVSKACFHLCEAHFLNSRISLEPKTSMPATAPVALLKVTATTTNASDAKV
jgi:peptidoglycan/LPS O-acetylase OafA/YrhL